MIGIAYVDSKKEREENDEKRKNKSKELGFFKSIKEYFINLYNRNQRYIHIEIAIIDDEDQNSGECEAFGVFSGEGVFNKRRTFNNPSYEWMFLNATELEIKKLRSFCKSKIGEKFDSYGAYAYMFAPRTRNSKNKVWWCTSFAVSALQSIGILKYYNPFSLSVDEVIFLLKEHYRAVGSIPPSIRKSTNIKDISIV